MLAERDRLLAELIAWLDGNGVRPDGPFFLRLHTVDMAGEMDIEVGVFAAAAGDAEVAQGAAPAGDYVVLRYVNHSLRAHRLLFAWAETHGIRFDVQDADWAGRFETYVTDPRTEPRKTRRQTELAFLTR